MLRAALSIFLGAVLALLMALAAQLLLAPFFHTGSWAGLSIVSHLVFWGVFLSMLVAVLRGRRAMSK